MNYELAGVFDKLINTAGASCSSSSGGVISGGGQMMGSFGYGAVTMETKFRVSTYGYITPLCPNLTSFKVNFFLFNLMFLIQLLTYVTMQ